MRTFKNYLLDRNPELADDLLREGWLGRTAAGVACALGSIGCTGQSPVRQEPPAAVADDQMTVGGARMVRVERHGDLVAMRVKIPTALGKVTGENHVRQMMQGAWRAEAEKRLGVGMKYQSNETEGADAIYYFNITRPAAPDKSIGNKSIGNKSVVIDDE